MRGRRGARGAEGWNRKEPPPNPCSNSRGQADLVVGCAAAPSAQILPPGSGSGSKAAQPKAVTGARGPSLQPRGPR